jgi:hypothetical protein
MPRFTVESWSPEYGSPVEEGGSDDARQVEVDLDVEVPADRWQPLSPAAISPPGSVSFVDGVRRIDARLWFVETDAASMGLCASYAAGVVRCGARAEVETIAVARGLFSRTATESIATEHGEYVPYQNASDEFDALSVAIQLEMGRLERQVAASASKADLCVLDGPLSARDNIPDAVGYIKSHRADYLPAEGQAIVASLNPGQRTPVFLTQTTWSRYSWYLRLPGGQGHPWAGVVRCEVTTGRSVAEVRSIADVTAATLPRYASGEHRDARAPQNLYPIAGLEQQLRHRLGDRELMVRALRRAAN